MPRRVQNPVRSGPAGRHSVGPVNRAWTVWAVALSAYLLAIFHRSSLAVAGLAAADRFDISAAQLATFTMLQLLVYAGMQIPVGLLVDRYGPRSVMLVGAIVLTVAQAGFAAVGVVRRGAGRPRLRRHGRRDDLDLPAPAGGELVHRSTDPDRDRLVRDARPARSDRGGRADDVGAGEPRLDRGLPDRRRGERRGVGRGGGRRPRHPRGPHPARSAADLRHRPGEPRAPAGPIPAPGSASGCTS